MFAVFKTGGKQYRVKVDDIVKVEKIFGQEGDKIQFNDILFLDNNGEIIVGAPWVEDAGVQASICQQIKGQKVIKFVKRRRKSSSKRTRGHRQKLTAVKIEKILSKGAAQSGVRDASVVPLEKPANIDRKTPKKAKGTAKTTPKDTKPKNKKTAEPAKTKISVAPADSKTPSTKTADALSKLKGVGAKTVEKLHANGIFHFEQIAKWRSDDIASMDEKLDAKGKITKDDWIGQAKAFISEKE